MVRRDNGASGSHPGGLRRLQRLHGGPGDEGDTAPTGAVAPSPEATPAPATATAPPAPDPTSVAPSPTPATGPTHSRARSDAGAWQRSHGWELRRDHLRRGRGLGGHIHRGGAAGATPRAHRRGDAHDGLSGEVHLDGRPSTIEIDLQSLSSDQQYRDRYVRTQMFGSHRSATFTAGDVGALPEEFTRGEVATGSGTGQLEIRGITVPLALEIEARDDGDVINIIGRTTFTWDEFQIPVPRARSVVSIEDEVRVEILLVVRPQGSSSLRSGRGDDQEPGGLRPRPGLRPWCGTPPCR